MPKKKEKAYFNEAKSWADDLFFGVQQSRNRYQRAFVISMGLNIAALISVCMLSHYQQLVPLVIHHYENGVTTVDAIDKQNAPQNEAQIKSDIVRYVTNREAYAISSYRAQFDLISLLSSEPVTRQYIQEQDKSSADSPVHVLKMDGLREVHVYDVIFLDTEIQNEKDVKKNHHNLAEVIFTLTDKHESGTALQTKQYTALVSWMYTTPPESPAERWLNWNGFKVTRYSKTLRNI